MCCKQVMFSGSGLISDKGTIQEAVTSIKRNGVGLKGRKLNFPAKFIILF